MNIRIEPNDFHWWRSFKEKTESSRSLISFSHYIAHSHSKALTVLQVKKVNLTLCIGLPLERWLHRILVLIEKESGNIDIDKLNWLLKIIFSKKLMGRAIETNLLPQEFFAQKGTSTMEAIITQTLLCDINRLQHRTFLVVSADLSQCFDSVGHAQCNLSL